MLELDSELVSVGGADEAQEAVVSLSRQFAICSERDGEARNRCIVQALFAGDTLTPTRHDSMPQNNTVTTALTEGRGSCAALTATVLALTDGPEAPFVALILRDHVLLGSAASEGVYYELLDGGKRVPENRVVRHKPHPPGGPVRVTGADYVPYYVDNLAARLAEAGEFEPAELAFRKALALGPKIARIHYNYGTFLLQRSRFKAAERYLSRAIRLGWNDADAFVNRATARWKLGQEKAARRDLRRALELDPRHPQASINLRRLESE